MSIARLQSRRYSLPSLGTAKPADSSPPGNDPNASMPTERKRKLNEADRLSPDAKRPAVTLTGPGGLQESPVSKEQLGEAICCLPGGE